MSTFVNRNQVQRSFHNLFLLDNASSTFIPTGYPGCDGSLIYRIPPHQRFYKWTSHQESLFIDSIIQNYPIHSIITTTRIDTTNATPTIFYDVEDGQSRLTCCWKFANDKFTIVYDNRECTFSDLPSNLRTAISNYMIPFEELTFNGILTRQQEQSIVSEIFIRINYGRQLTHNDKYHACSHAPAMVVLKFLNEQVFKDQMKEFCGSIGTGKTRSMLSDMCAVILAIAHGTTDSLITSFSENYHLMQSPINDDSISRIRRFFAYYFEMLDTNNAPGKKFGKLPGFLGYCAYLFITDTDNDFRTNPALRWYLSKLTENKKFVPSTFTILPSASQRNCGSVAINARIQAITVAYEHRNRENVSQNNRDYSSDESDTD